LLEHVIAFNYPSASERYDRVGEIFGARLEGLGYEERCRTVVGAIAAFKNAVGILPGLAGRGVRRDDVRELARKALADPCMVTNPRRPQLRDIELIYEEAL